MRELASLQVRAPHLRRDLEFRLFLGMWLWVADIPEALFSLLQSGISNLCLTDSLATFDKIESVRMAPESAG